MGLLLCEQVVLRIRGERPHFVGGGHDGRFCPACAGRPAHGVDLLFLDGGHTVRPRSLRCPITKRTACDRAAGEPVGGVACSQRRTGFPGLIFLTSGRLPARKHRADGRLCARHGVKSVACSCWLSASHLRRRGCRCNVQSQPSTFFRPSSVGRKSSSGRDDRVRSCSLHRGTHA